MGNGRKDFCNLKAIKERSNRIEDGAKKQNEYQERRLNKYITGIEKEHESNMLMLRAQERELRKSEGRFNEHLSRKRGDNSALPSINPAENDMIQDGHPGEKQTRKKKQRSEAWVMNEKTKESVLERLLNIPAPSLTVNNNHDEDIQPKPFQNEETKTIKFPPLLQMK